MFRFFADNKIFSFRCWKSIK